MQFMQQASLAIRGSLHELLTKYVDPTSMVSVAQSLRDLEHARELTRNNVALTNAQVQVIQQHRNDLVNTIAKKTANAKLYRDKNDQDNAMALATQIIDDQATLAGYDQQIAEAQSQAMQMKQDLEKVDALYNKRMGEYNLLKIKSQSTQSLNQNTRAMKAVVETMDSGGVDDLSDRINTQNIMAKEQFNQTMEGINGPPDPMRDAAAADLLKNL